NFDDRDEVAPAKSPRSINASFKPRIDASRATAAPLIPAPITARSNSSSRNRARLLSRLRVAANESDRSVFRIFLERVALLGPGVGVIVIAANFPESAPVDIREFDRAHPFCPLPSVKLRHDQPQRKSVVRLEVAPVMPM